MKPLKWSEVAAKTHLKPVLSESLCLLSVGPTGGLEMLAPHHPIPPGGDPAVLPGQWGLFSLAVK